MNETTLSARRTLDLAMDLLDGLVQGVDRAARDLVDDAAALWRSVEDGAGRLGGDLEDLGRELADGPARVARLASTGWVLAQIAASYRFHAATEGFRTREGAERALLALHARNARRFTLAAMRRGGAFLKVGQMLSARMDLLPDPWVGELSKLQDAVPPAPFERVRPLLESDLGGPLEVLFREFDEEPVAAASIGQVHRALLPDGRVAAVKVQRPGIRELVELDLSLFEITLESLRSLLPPTDTETIAREVRAMVRQELDYANEARMMARVADFFEDHPDVVVPRPIAGLCGPRAFASTFVEGRKITEALDAGDQDDAHVLGVLLECYLRQVLQCGVFQADPHPGNLLVTPDGKLVLLDFGCTKPMPDELRALYLALLQAFLRGDRERMAALFHDLGFATASGRPDTLHAFADALLQAFQHSLDGGQPFVWMTQEEVFAQAARLMQLSEADPVTRIPAEFVMLGRVFGTLGGLFHHYRPSLDAGRHVLPVVGEALLELP